MLKKNIKRHVALFWNYFSYWKIITLDWNLIYTQRRHLSCPSLAIAYKCMSMFFIYTCETRFDSVEFFNCWNNFRDLLSSMWAIERILKLNARTLWEKIVLSAHPALPPRFKLLNDKCFLFLPRNSKRQFSRLFEDKYKQYFHSYNLAILFSYQNISAVI